MDAAFFINSLQEESKFGFSKVSLLYYGKIKYKKVQSNRSKLKIYLIKKTYVSLCKSQKSYFNTIVFYTKRAFLGIVK